MNPTMCPACITTALLTAVGVSSTGGLTALVLKNFGGNPSEIIKPEWLVARKDLLKREKELTHLRHEISRHRLELPWVKVEKEYVFDAPDGKVTLVDRSTRKLSAKKNNRINN